MKSFSIVAIRIFDDCASHIRKTLCDEWYFFSERYTQNDGVVSLSENYRLPKSFFSEKININAIVGKNGCGKSALIELLLRIINNFSARLINTNHNDLYCVSGVHASLYFEIDEILWFINVDGENISVNKNGAYHNNGCQLDLDNIHDSKLIGDIISIKEAIPLLRQLFFTIVGNYSMHSYNAPDFIHEGQGLDNVWIKGLFHKNDGYLTPVVLNPFRSDGFLNIKKETYLTNNRLAALFYLFDKQGLSFMDEYKYKSLEFRLNKGRIIDKYKYYPIINKKQSKKERVKVIKLDINKRDYFNVTLKAYIGDANIKDDLKLAYQYLVAKTFAISRTYPNYKNNVSIAIQDLSKYCNAIVEGSIKKLVEKIKRDKSHTSLKIRQVLKYIDYVNDETTDEILTQAYIDKYFDNTTSSDIISAEQILEFFPPSFFDIKIILEKNDQVISFERMSSGERQFLFYMSTILYHLRNLDSVVDDSESVHYRYVNIILEEVELYFHPEYQRKLIDKLIRYIEASNYQNLDCFNITIVTHSPFVLSDIPKCNIMFLQDGRQLDESNCFNTLGANIHDLLRQGFFLNDGLVGEQALEIIGRIIKYCTPENTDNITPMWSKEEILFIINSIGEPIVRDSLLDMYNNKWSNVDAIKEQIRELQEKLTEIESYNETNLH